MSNEPKTAPEPKKAADALFPSDGGTPPVIVGKIRLEGEGGALVDDAHAESIRGRLLASGWNPSPNPR